MSNSLAGRVVLLPGAAGGIGSAVAQDLAAHGATTILIDLDGDRVTALTEAINRDGGEARAYVIDLLQFEDAERIIGDVVATFGKVDALCYLAGVTILGRSIDVSPDEFRTTLEANLTAQFAWATAAARTMIPMRSGTIVLMASVLGFGGMPRRAAYTASRGGVVQLVRTLATEWAEAGIRVNAVAPGWVQTPTVLSLGLDLESFRQRIPMKRLGDPKDIAGPIRFLLSEDSGWVTGVTLPVDGGVLAYVGPGDPADA